MSTGGELRGSRVLAAADAGACEPMALPSVGTGGRRDSSHLAPITAAQLETLQREAWAEAYERGRAEGDARGFREGTERANEQMQPLLDNLRGMLDTLAEPLAQLDDEVEQNLLALSFACARQLVGHELRSEPGLVVKAVREALSALPLASREVRILLNREDLPRVREALGEVQDAGWHLMEDPGVQAGGCRVESEFSRVDASIDGRLNAIIAQVLGGERTMDGADDDPD